MSGEETFKFSSRSLLVAGCPRRKERTDRPSAASIITIFAQILCLLASGHASESPGIGRTAQPASLVRLTLAQGV